MDSTHVLNLATVTIKGQSDTEAKELTTKYRQQKGSDVHHTAFTAVSYTHLTLPTIYSV